MISIVSRVRRTGFSKRTPCQPSITCGPLVPTPSTNLPPDSACIESEDMASIAGVRAPSWTMPVARRIVEVQAAKYARGVSASPAQNSGTQTESAPRRSASRTKSTLSGWNGVAQTPMRSVTILLPSRDRTLGEALDAVERRPHVGLELLEPASDDALLLVGHRVDRDREARRRGTHLRVLPETHTPVFLLEL